VFKDSVDERRWWIGSAAVFLLVAFAFGASIATRTAALRRRGVGAAATRRLARAAARG
jgi:hypothetical protein